MIGVAIAVGNSHHRGFPGPPGISPCWMTMGGPALWVRQVVAVMDDVSRSYDLSEKGNLMDYIIIFVEWVF